MYVFKVTLLQIYHSETLNKVRRITFIQIQGRKLVHSVELIPHQYGQMVSYIYIKRCFEILTLISTVSRMTPDGHEVKRNQSNCGQARLTLTRIIQRARVLETRKYKQEQNDWVGSKFPNQFRRRRLPQSSFSGGISYTELTERGWTGWNTAGWHTDGFLNTRWLKLDE